MSKLTEIKLISKLALRPQNLLCNTKYLFIFSHMRSRSTLLSHILGSNPNICGHSELHISYKKRLNLMKMRAHIFNNIKIDFNNKYLLDKILHDYPISDEIFKITQPKIVILLREPESTLKSIINMQEITGIKLHKNKKKWQIIIALAY